MKSSIQRKLYIGFAAAIILVIAVGAVSFFTFQREAKESSLVKETYQVINELVVLQKLLVDMETGRRGFRSTNEKMFLQPYYVGLEKVGPTLLELKKLIKDDLKKIKKTEQIERDISDLLAFWKGLGDQARVFDKERVLGLMTSEKALMDKVRAGIGEMIDYERRLLFNQEIEDRRIVNDAKWKLIVGILLILVIVILLINQILKEFKTRQKVEAGLKKNYKEITLLNQENAERSWLLAGLAKVNDTLQGSYDVNELTKVILDTIVKYLNFKAGAFYIYNEDSKKLYLTAAYALPDQAKKEYNLYEGFVGQAATEKNSLTISNLPPQYARVEGGSIQAEPVHAIFASFIHNDELKGIIELLSFEPIVKSHLSFLKTINNNISESLNAAQARQKTKEVLDKLQLQKEELENQQEELSQTNEELKVQAEVMQAAEEELRVQEEELRQMNTELQEKNKAVESARHDLALKAKELESAGRYKSEFLANMSHELRTPLNSILILAQLLANNKDKNLTEKQIAHAKIIHKSGSDLLELINDILDLSKIEAGKASIHIEEVSTATIMEEMQQMFGAVAEEKGIDFSITEQANTPKSLETDKQKVGQVLKNLLSNAFKFTPGKGKVQCVFKNVNEGQKDYLSISVIDTGIGITKAQQQIIFDAFQQADGSTNRKFGGTGLGLSISKELMRLLDGKIFIESEEGKGSSFTIILPVKNSKVLPAVQNDQLISEQVKIPDERHSLKDEDKTILIIEDDEGFASVIKDFAVANGYKTIVALNGEEGLFCAKKYNPSAIILDMKLPGIAGSDLLKRFKDDEKLKHIPVHVMSAFENTIEEAKGAIAFLKKPVNEEDINEAFLVIGRHLKRTAKHLLIVSKSNLKDEIERKLIKEKHYEVVCEDAENMQQALHKLKTTDYDCLIADIDGDINEGISQLNLLNSSLLTRKIPIIICLDQDITTTHEFELKKIGEVVVRKSLFSNSRIIEELELFLNKVEANELKNPDENVPKVVIGKSLENKKVLVVDDDMRNIFALTSALEEEQMEISTANNGKEALEYLENNSVDIVLMDVMMPEMDGYEAMRYIRQKLNLINLPIIALTAKAMSGDKEKCIAAGASDYISKPVDFGKLISLIKVWM